MLSWLLSLGMFFSHAQALENPPIRVRLDSSIQKIEFEGLGTQIYGRAKNFEFVAIPHRQTIEISKENVQGKDFWKVVRNHGRPEYFGEPILALKAIDLRSQGKSYPGQLILSSMKNHKFDVIGVLPLENYLVGVIASEMPLSWPMETLKAQAIAARSYALVTMKERSHQAYHVESTILDQVFSHIGNGPDENPLVSKAKEAVRETQGLVLMTSRGKVLKAYYHSDCGGHTASSKSVWGYGDSVGAVVDPGCPANPRAHWNLELSQDSLSEKLRAYLKRPVLGVLESLQLIRPSSGERVQKVRLAWQNGETDTVSAQEFRSILGYEQMRSTLFEVQKSEGEFRFTGRGFGHGVGLCQWGARFMGKQGKSSTAILSHYYPQALIQELGVRTEQRLEAQIR